MSHQQSPVTPTACPVELRWHGSRLPSFRRRAVLSVLGTVVVAVSLAVALAGHRAQFATALNTAAVWVLLLATALHILALLARSEAWNVSVRAAGGTVTRRLLFRAAGIGYLASVVNGSVGMAVRIASLRRAAPDDSPPVPALLAAEVPIITVEVALAAVFSFTLVAPLSVPWWVPALFVALTLGAVAGLRRISERRRLGLWAGLAVMRTGRARMIAFVLLAVCAQIARNWLVLQAIGLHVTVLEAIAMLIAMFTLGQLPIGPGVGAAAAVLILGAHGVAATAAAGVLLTITAIVGALCYAAWAVTDRLLGGALPATSQLAVAPGGA